jgi:hypothetical protein
MDESKGIENQLENIYGELVRLRDIREVCYNAYLMSWGICFLLFLILLVLFF